MSSFGVLDEALASAFLDDVLAVSGGFSEEEIRNLEAAIGIQIPKRVRAFFLEFGTLYIHGSSESSGVGG